MSQDFNFIFVAPLAPLGQLVKDLVPVLQKLGFSCLEEVTHYGLWLPENIEPEPVASLEKFAECKYPEWTDVGLSFFHEDGTIGLTIARWQEAFLNIYVDVTEKKLMNFAKSGSLHVYYCALWKIANVVNAFGGIGGMNYGPKFLSLQELRDTASNPKLFSYSYIFSLLSCQDFSEDVVRQIAGEPFQVKRLGPFWLIVGEWFEQRFGLVEPWRMI